MDSNHHQPASRDPIEQSDRCPASCPLRQDDARLPPLIHVPPPKPVTDVERVEAANRIYITKVQRWQTRVLVLQPGQLNDELVADLVVVDLTLGEGVVAHDRQTIITYSALSYAWGAPVYDQRITMNGQIYPITEHLYRALQRIREERSSTGMWIDALCINQLDTSERSTQVANMLAIYYKASQVLVWLGDFAVSEEHAETEALAIDYLDSMHARIDHATDGGVSPDAGLDLVHSKDCATKAPTLLNGLYHIYGRPWQTRLWIRQEVWAAYTVKVLLGDRAISWKSFRLGETAVDHARHWLNHCHENHFSKYQEIEMTRRLSILQTLALSDPGVVAGRLEQSYRRLQKDDSGSKVVRSFKTDILNVLLSSLQSDCSDPKDRIYGIIGMTDAQTRPKNQQPYDDSPEIVVDYGKSVAQVYMDLAGYLIDRDRHYGVLGLAAEHGKLEDLDLPSWCPDWRTILSRDMYDDNGVQWFGELPHNPPPHKPEPCSRRLNVRGVQIGSLGDTIAFSEPGLLSQDGDSDYAYMVFAWEGGLLGAVLGLEEAGKFFTIQTNADKVESTAEHGGPKAVFITCRRYHDPDMFYHYEKYLREGGKIGLHPGAENGGIQTPAYEVKTTLEQGAPKAMLVTWRSDYLPQWYGDPPSTGVPMFVPRAAQASDVLVLIKGCLNPIVLRPNEQDHTYSLIGQIGKTHHKDVNGHNRTFSWEYDLVRSHLQYPDTFTLC